MRGGGGGLGGGVGGGGGECTGGAEGRTAPAEILRVISSSQMDARPVFEAIAVNAAQLCHGARGAVFRYDGQLVSFVTTSDKSPERLATLAGLYPRPPAEDSLVGKAILQRTMIHAPDVTREPRLPTAPLVTF